MKILGMILNWLGGGIITDLVNSYFRSIEKRAESSNERERIQANRQLAEIKEQSETVRWAMGFRIFWVVWCLFTVPLGVYFAWIILVDKLCVMLIVPEWLGGGWCGSATDPLQGEIALWARVIVNSIFPSGALVGGAQVIAKAIDNRRR